MQGPRFKAWPPLKKNILSSMKRKVQYGPNEFCSMMYQNLLDYAIYMSWKELHQSYILIMVRISHCLNNICSIAWQLHLDRCGPQTITIIVGKGSSHNSSIIFNSKEHKDQQITLKSILLKHSKHPKLHLEEIR